MCIMYNIKKKKLSCGADVFVLGSERVWFDSKLYYIGISTYNLIPAVSGNIGIMRISA